MACARGSSRHSNPPPPLSRIVAYFRSERLGGRDQRVMSCRRPRLLAELRRNLIAGASGDVLEIGRGTGTNLGYYGAGAESVTN